MKTKIAEWPGSWVFVLAAIGSAAGLGNVWRFPYLAFEHGGAAFFIAYIVCLAIIGFPLLLLENAMGQKTGHAAPEAMGKGDKSGFLRFIGFWGVLAAALVMSYYSVVMSWSVNYLASSPGLRFAGDASDYFFNTVLRISEGPLDFGSVVPHIFVGLLVVWLFIYFALFQGMRSITKVVTFITPLPFIFLVTMAINGAFLSNSSAGLEFFLVPDWTKLLTAQIWSAAASQVFFTLTLGFGVMFAYGALLNKKVNLVKSAAFVVIGDTLVAFCAGLAIFSTLGYMAGVKEVAVADVVAGGPGLAFVVFPEALSLLPAGGSIFASLFFITLLALALTSAISLVQAVVSVIMDYFSNWNYSIVVLGVCAVLFFMATPFSLQSGLYLLDIVDHFILNYGLMLVGLFEAVAIGWIFGAKRLREYINKTSKTNLKGWFDIAIMVVIPLVLALLTIQSLSADLLNPYEGYDEKALFIFGLFPVIMVLLLSFALGLVAKHAKDRAKTKKRIKA